ncbi:tRNA 2-selenouridine(34) synthase MnmH [Haloferula sp. A504]|uniref:tRNA 2-selenouridine(34) synthase MnmH n=1 Tax=Haloferula sp. A504 TaxID=3373601 RepID=UPI0031BCADAE|nr:tRNA 2-selenouridine(34) synthase MnmH [Verrucomicrobiaceae bacterium E54]
MAKALPTDEFLARAKDLPVIDVRSPSEFNLGHIPGAVNVPLFSDEERARIGKTYKQLGRQPAVMLGLRCIGPRMDEFARELLGHASRAGDQALVHCWRGGMRSGSVAWLLESFGCQVATLKGGYKAFRNWVLDGFEQPRAIHVVTGLTGSGKTEVLGELAVQGEQVIDLEALAHHKGSAFGSLGQKPAPTQQQFENRLAFEWRAADPDRPLWLEDESRTIGRIRLPLEIWRQKQAGEFHRVEVPDEDRVQHLCDGYAGHPPTLLAERVEAIRKRLGGDRVKEAIEAIETGDATTACRIVLAYYDKTYRHSLKRAAPANLTSHSFDRLDPAEMASTLAAAVRSSPP